MATTSPAVLNGHSESENVPLSAAQKLQQKHDSHKATIEEVADEEDLKPHRPEPVSSSVLEAPGDESAPGWLPPVSLKAAGKRKEETSSKPSLDISEEAFPALGGLPKTKQPATINSNWKNSNKMANGTNGTSSNGIPSGTTGSSTPTTRISTPLGGGDPRNLTIPGQVKEDYFLAKEYMLPRQALKKPLPDILKDFNKKSRKVTVNHSAGANGTTFSAAGPSREACQQALKDILAQVGAKVCVSHLTTIPRLTFNRSLQKLRFLNQPVHILSAKEDLRSRKYKREVALRSKYRNWRMRLIQLKRTMTL